MEQQIEQDLLGFEESSIKLGLLLSLKHKSLIEGLEKIIRYKMSLLATKYYEDGTNSSNGSFKGLITDNDSGYISQTNMESNSSVETNDNRQVMCATSTCNAKDVYVNEDTLLEKPRVSSKHNKQENTDDEEYEEFGHLFYMSSSSEPILESSAVSQNTTFSGFEADESGISDTSGTIHIAAPIVVSANVLNIESNSTEDVNNSSASHSCTKITDSFLPFVTNNPKEFLCDSEENNPNELDVKSNWKLISPVIEEENMEHKGLTLNSSLEKKDLNCIQTRMRDACDTSLFESFYSHLCGLYTRNDFPSEDLTKIAINPHNLQISNNELLKDPSRENILYNSPYKNSYLQLETINKNTAQVNSATPNFEINQSTEIPSDADQSIKENVALEPINVLSSEIKQSLLGKCPENEVKNNQAKLNHPLTPAKQYKNPVNSEMSPELFSDEEPLEITKSLSRSFSQIQKNCEKIYITKNDRKLLKNAQESLAGVLPPPSITIIQMSVNEMLQKIKDNEHLFVNNSAKDLSKSLDVNSEVLDNSSNHVQKNSVNTDNLRRDNKTCKSKTAEIKKSLLVTSKKDDVISGNWPDVMQYRYHGLHHNRSKISEDFEHLCLKYAERCIGAETQSSCTIFRSEVLSPSKRRFKLRRAMKSPGKRLSHLAKRRITFSKDSLQGGVGPSSCSFIGARTRQIMVDARKFELLSRRKSPRKKSPRKTPGKSPRKKTQTPSSSAKKRFATRLRMYHNEESMNSVASTSSSRASVTKRALFQSPPDKGETTNGLLQLFTSNTSGSESSQPAKRRTPRRALFTSPLRASPSKMSISSLYPPKRKETPKRALFMSPEKSPSKRSEHCDRKRKRVEMDDENPSKLSRSMLLNAKDPLNESKSRTATRSQSVTGAGSLQGQDIVEHRKKKLMWAVAEALRSQNIDIKHAQFKVFASVLARVIRHFLPNLFNNGPRPEGSSTESMLRIARQHVFSVTRGKTVSQILRESEKSKVRPVKPSGYVGLDKVDNLSGVALSKNKENVLHDRVNIIGSDRLGSESSRSSKASRVENVERIRRVIDFGNDDEVGNRNGR